MAETYGTRPMSWYAAQTPEDDCLYDPQEPISEKIVAIYDPKNKEYHIFYKEDKQR